MRNYPLGDDLSTHSKHSGRAVPYKLQMIPSAVQSDKGCGHRSFLADPAGLLFFARLNMA